MQDESRFGCPSAALALKHLLWRTSHIPWVALGITLLAHGGSTLWRGTEQKTHVVKPLTIQFVKRQPRLTKPLELRKRPAPKRRSMQRKMVSVQARIDRQATTSTVRPMEMVQSLARPDAEAMRSIFFAGITIEPQAVAQAIESTRESASQVDMSLEMVDIEALDTGKYHAMVVQDPTDKRSITGFFHFVRAYSRTMRHTNLPSYDECEDRQAYALKRLAIYISDCTDIRTDVTGANVPVDCDDILKVPWVYLGTLWPFKLSVAELQHLGRYLLQGGFLFTETLYAPAGVPEAPSYPSFRDMFLEALAWEGVKGRAFEPIPNSHPIYHCYFDFDGPPMGGHPKLWKYEIPPRLHPYLEGLLLEGGRLVGIISQKWYANAWGDWGPSGYAKRRLPDLDPTRPLQFGVNLIIFALTQEGSVTHQLMESVK